MGERALENRIKKLLEIEKQKKELEEKAEEVLRTEIKNDLESKVVDEVKTKNLVVRWKEVISNRLDSKAFKDNLLDIYALYVKSSSAKRFTIG